MGEEHIVLHNVGCVSGVGILVHWDIVVESDLTWQLCLVNKRNTIGKNVKQRCFTGTGGTHDVSGDTGRSKTRAVFDDLLTSEFFSGSFDFLFVLFYLDLEEDIFPS